MPFPLCTSIWRPLHRLCLANFTLHLAIVSVSELRLLLLRKKKEELAKKNAKKVNRVFGAARRVFLLFVLRGWSIGRCLNLAPL